MERRKREKARPFPVEVNKLDYGEEEPREIQKGQNLRKTSPLRIWPVSERNRNGQEKEKRVSLDFLSNGEPVADSLPPHFPHPHPQCP